MKILFLIYFCLMLNNNASAKLLTIKNFIPAHAFSEGGSTVGNGGGTVVCRDPSTHQILNAELLDYFESRMIRGMDNELSKIPGNWKVKAQFIIDRLNLHSQLRTRIYSQWLKSFEDETKFISGIEFNKTSDSMEIGVPKGCQFEQAAIQIQPRFAEDKRYYLNLDIWSSLDENNKAGLVLHEIIYREALSYGHTDSIATRYFNSFITSSNFIKSSFASFLNILAQARFETTDFPLDDPDFSMTYMTKHLWRAGSDEKFPQEMEFNNRVVGAVGSCVDLGCKTFYKNDLTLDMAGFISSLTIDRGVVKIALGTYSMSAQVDDPSSPSWWPGPPLNLQLQSGKLASLSVKDLNTSNYLLKLTDPNMCAANTPDCEVSNLARIVFSQENGIGIKSMIGQMFYYNSVILTAGKAEVGNKQFGCKTLRLDFSGNHLFSVSVGPDVIKIKNGCDENLTPSLYAELALGKPYGSTVFGEPTIDTKNPTPNGSYYFSESGVLESSRFKAIRFDSSNWLYSSTDLTPSIYASIYSNSKDLELGRIYQVQITSNTKITMDTEEKYIELSVSTPQTIDLYPNGAPKKLIIAEDSKLKNASGETIEVTHGSVVEFNDQGLVLSSKTPQK